MSNPQVIIGGAAVSVPMTTLGNPYGQAVSPSSFLVTNRAGQNIAGGSLPPPGASASVNGMVFTNTGATTTVGGALFPVFTVSATATAPVGTGYALELYNSGAGSLSAYGLFDVVAAGGGGGTGPALPPNFWTLAVPKNLHGQLQPDADGYHWDVNFTWDPSPTAGYVGYRLYQSQFGTQSQYQAPSQPPTLVYQGTATNATATGLVPRVSYGYDVCTYDAGGNESAHAPGLTFRPDPSPIRPTEIISPDLDSDTQLTGTITIRAQVGGGAGGIKTVVLVDHDSGAAITTLAAPTVEPDLYDLVWDLSAYPPVGYCCVYSEDVGTAQLPSESRVLTRCARTLGYHQ